ncbi:MAG: hypothetical protein AAGF85_13965 [Bacteroidota bacterium]
MKSLRLGFLIGILMLSTRCSSNKKDKLFIESFITELNVESEYSFIEFKEKDYFIFSNPDSADQIYEEDSFYTEVLIELKKKFKCKEEIEILSLEESQVSYGFDENLNIDQNSNYTPYIIYCENDMITRILMSEGRIAALVTMSKGPKDKYFILL